MSRNLKYQFLQSINNSFSENMDKYSDKINGIRNTDKIYSYSSRTNLINLSANFSNFMKEHFPEVRMVKQVCPKHIQAFLVSKAHNCSQATLNQYCNLFYKLEKCVNKKYHCTVDYHHITAPISVKNGGAKIRNTMLSAKDYNAILQNATNHNLVKALVLSYTFGLRASECAKIRYEDIKSNGISIVHSKGKRSRFIPVETEKEKKILQFFQQGQTGRVCPIKHESLEQAFRREVKKNNIHIENGAFHTSRKSYATRKYKEYRSSGLSASESISRVSVNLGHSANRHELMKEYICCPLT